MPFGFGKKSNDENPSFEAKYVGGHKLHPKSRDVTVQIAPEKLTVSEINLEVSYKSITNIENADEAKISAMRVVLLGVIGALWKKKHLYTVIQFKDELGNDQSMIFDFDKKIEEVQPLIYNKVVEARKNG